MMETATRTLLCGDLFTQGGSGATPITESDILGPSEAFRAPMDYFAHAPHPTAVFETLARPELPTKVPIELLLSMRRTPSAGGERYVLSGTVTPRAGKTFTGGALRGDRAAFSGYLGLFVGQADVYITALEVRGLINPGVLKQK